jgi:hypothetical protein
MRKVPAAARQHSIVFLPPLSGLARRLNGPCHPAQSRRSYQPSCGRAPSRFRARDLPWRKLFYERLGTPQRTFKRDYHNLAEAIPVAEIAPEVSTVLDAILAAANRAKPAV